MILFRAGRAVRIAQLLVDDNLTSPPGSTVTTAHGQRHERACPRAAL
ncbi:MAG: hypothetical protein ACRDTE_01850 [Pseudonocardiaceae bacterium]